MKRIVIAGTSVYGIENQGDEALLKMLCDSLRETFGQVELTLLARHPSPELDAAFGIRSIKNFEHDSKAQSQGRWFYGLNPNDPPDSLGAIRESIEACDLLVIGGDPFNEISLAFYRGLAPYAAILITLAKFLEKPVLLYAIHMGRPLESNAGRELIKFCLTNSSCVTLREAFSQEVLQKMEIPTGNTVVLADPAFGLAPFPDRSAGQPILEAEGIRFTSPRVVGFNFRHQYWSWSDSQWQHYRTLLAETADMIVAEFDADLLFIPNCTYQIDHHYEDDRPVAREIAAAMKHSHRAHQIVNKYSLSETLSLFPFLDLHFSNRRHSLIFAAVHGVPVVATGGEWHIKPALDDLGVGNYFLPVENLTASDLKASLRQAWNERQSLQQRLQSALPQLRERARGIGLVVAELLKV